MSPHDTHAEGYDAYWDGIERDDNPYKVDDAPAERIAWEEGWDEARQHDYDESE